ncbi:DUF6895 family protein [Pseudomonas chlororaphis]|uniref:DUF6895 family protein n=1 Tax=Pseudomonas chlororaphis TaxID=587753 RepID=UPI000BE355DD|nr:hypothetical protein [Pseudomonas chlororaphis]
MSRAAALLLARARPVPEASGPRPDRQDLPIRVGLALEMADHALSVALEERPTNPSTPAERPLLLQKVVAESTLLLRCCAFLRTTDDEWAARIERLAARLAPLARSDSTRASLCREPARAIEHATAHVLLADLGYPDATFDGLLGHVLGSDESAAGERLAGQDLEREWLLQVRAGTARRDGAEPGLLGRSGVAHPLDALRASSYDIYAFTHVVLHATDMGQRAVTWPRGHAPLVADAEAALAVALDADNLDLAAEVLWTWPMAGLAWTPAAVFAFELLARVQDEHGFMPGPEYSHENEPGGEQPWSRHALRTSYHATFVMGFLCAAMQRPRPVMPSRVAEPGTGTLKALGRITRQLDGAGNVPRWLDAFVQSAPARQAALAPLLLTVALRRTAAASDIARLRECLAIGLDHGLAEGLAFEQGLRLLERATQFAGSGRST